jgi:hypothetical protein
MPASHALDSWRVSAAYFVVVGCIFISPAFVSVRSQHSVRLRLVAPQTDTIGVTDVLGSARPGNLANFGLAFLILLGPVAGIFKSSMLLAAIGILLLVTAVMLSRRWRLGAWVGTVWALGVVVLLVIAMAQISVSYSFAARLLMFGPASALNLGLLVALGRSLTPSPSVTNT